MDNCIECATPVTAAKVVTAVKRKALEDVFKPAPAIVHEVKRHCIFHYINIAITNMISYFLQVLLEEMSTAPCPAVSKPVHLARAANRLRQSNRPADPTSIDFDLREDVLPESWPFEANPLRALGERSHASTRSIDRSTAARVEWIQMLVRIRDEVCLIRRNRSDNKQS